MQTDRNVSDVRTPTTVAQESWHTYLLLCGFVALAAALSIFFFSQQSLRLDEAQSLWQTTRSPGDILILVAQDVHVPLYHQVLHLWRIFVGDSVAAARALSLIFYLASIPALYALGTLAYGRRVGLLAAGLLSLSPFMNWYGSEIRMYTLFTLLVILNQYFYLKLWRTHAPHGYTDNSWIAYIATALLGIYTHYFFWLLLVSQAVFFLIRRDVFVPGSMRRFIGTWLLLVVALAPWIALVLLQGQAAAQSPNLATPSTVNLFNTFSQFLFGFPDDHLNTFFLSLWPLTLVLGLLALRKKTEITAETQYFLLSVVFSITAAFAVSFVVPVFVSRYLIFAVPALYLLITVLFALYPARGGAVARWGLVAVMVTMLALEIISPTTPVKEDYRAAAEFLTEHAGSQDVVLLSAPFTVYPVEYYYRGTAPLATLPAWDRYAYGPIPEFSAERLDTDVAAQTEAHQYAWVLLSYDQGYQEDVRQYFEQRYERVAQYNFSPALDLYQYKIRYDTPISDLEEEKQPAQ